MAGTPMDMRRHHELLPVRQVARLVSLGEGMTSLLPMPRIGQVLAVPDLLMKYEGVLPTGTFKPRGRRGRRLPGRRAGCHGDRHANQRQCRGRLVGLCGQGRDEQPDRDARRCSHVTQAGCVAAHGKLYLVDGTIGTPTNWSPRSSASGHGYLNAATLMEPYRIEGTMTIGMEIAE